MNKQQTIQTYKVVRNLKINIENELIAVCTTQELLDINERNLAIRRYRIDNPSVTEQQARAIVNANYNAQRQQEISG